MPKIPLEEKITLEVIKRRDETVFFSIEMRGEILARAVVPTMSDATTAICSTLLLSNCLKKNAT